MAADANATPVAWLGDTSEADNSSLIAFSSSGEGSITVAFRAQGGPPEYTPATVIADAGVDGSPFSGDYTAAGVVGLSFRITGDGHVPRFPAVVLVGKKSGRLWYNPRVTVSSVAGEVATNNVSFDLSAGWATDVSGDLAAMWQQDLQDVGMIGVRLVQQGLEAQSFTLDDFRLADKNGFITPPADMSPLEKALWAAFGVKSLDQLTDAQKKQDLDGDGMTDINEILSESDPNYANSIFAADIVPTGDTDGITIKWACVAGAKYTVFRSQDLTGGFHALTEAVDILAMKTGYMTYKDSSATGEGPYFYKIVKK